MEEYMRGHLALRQGLPPLHPTLSFKDGDLRHDVRSALA